MGFLCDNLLGRRNAGFSLAKVLQNSKCGLFGLRNSLILVFMKWLPLLIVLVPLSVVAQGGGQAADPNAVDLGDSRYRLISIAGTSADGLGQSIVPLAKFDTSGFPA